jgi:hypothetical protein
MNYWTTYPEVLVSWSVAFPPQTDHIAQLLDFAENALQGGAKWEVFIVDEPWLAAYEPIPAKAYRTYLMTKLAQLGELPLFYRVNDPSRSDNGKLSPSARVAFFDQNGAIQEKLVKDLGILLRDLRPEVKRSLHHYAAFAPPVSISGLTRVRVSPSSEEQYLEWPIDISIGLYSDIWFPRVAGFLDNPTSPISISNLFDNAELARRHTPRLNRFLQDVRTFAEALGASWSFEEPSGERDIYRTMCDVNGIILDNTLQ